MDSETVKMWRMVSKTRSQKRLAAASDATRTSASGACAWRRKRVELLAAVQMRQADEVETWRAGSVLTDSQRQTPPILIVAHRYSSKRLALTGDHIMR